MQTMAKIIEPGVYNLVFVGHVIPIRVTKHREFRGIGDPELVPFPSHRLHGVQALGECLHRFRHTVLVRIDKDFDVISR